MVVQMVLVAVTVGAQAEEASTVAVSAEGAPVVTVTRAMTGVVVAMEAAGRVLAATAATNSSVSRYSPERQTRNQKAPRCIRRDSTLPTAHKRLGTHQSVRNTSASSQLEGLVPWAARWVLRGPSRVSNQQCARPTGLGHGALHGSNEGLPCAPH